MNLFSSVGPTIYLEPKSVSLYVDKKNLQLKIPPGVVANQEVVDSDKYASFLKDLFTQAKLKNQEVVIVLANELIYSKSFVNKSSGVPQDDLESFFAQVPFDPSVQAKRIIPGKSETQVVVANKTLFEAIISVLDSCECKVNLIIPVSVVHGYQSGQQGLTEALVKEIWGSKAQLSSANFIGKEATKSHFTAGWFLVVMVLAILLVAGLTVILTKG